MINRKDLKDSEFGLKLLDRKALVGLRFVRKWDNAVSGFALKPYFLIDRKKVESGSLRFTGHSTRFAIYLEGEFSTFKTKKAAKEHFAYLNNPFGERGEFTYGPRETMWAEKPKKART